MYVDYIENIDFSSFSIVYLTLLFYGMRQNLGSYLYLFLLISLVMLYIKYFTDGHSYPVIFKQYIYLRLLKGVIEWQ